MERKKSIHVWLYTILIVGIIAAVIWGATAKKNAKARYRNENISICEIVDANNQK